MRSPVRAVAVVAAVLVMSFVAATAAPVAPAVERARYWNIYDGPRDARRPIDIKVTYLSARRPGLLVVTIQGYEFLRTSLNVAAANVDTRRANAGPEYRVQWLLPRDADGHAGIRLARIDTWDQRGRTIRCGRLGSSVDYGRDVVRLSIPRSCLGKPDKVRWNVYTGKVLEYLAHGKIRGYFDDVPGRKRFITGFWVG